MSFVALVIRTAARSRPPQRASAKRVPLLPPPPAPTQNFGALLWGPPPRRLFAGGSALSLAAATTTRLPRTPSSQRYQSSALPDWLRAVARESGDVAGAIFGQWAHANGVQKWEVVAATFEVASSVDQTQEFKNEFKALSAVQRGSLWAALKAVHHQAQQPAAAAASAGGNGGSLVLPIAKLAPLLQRELVDTAKRRTSMRFDFVPRHEYQGCLEDFQHNTAGKSSGSKYRVSVFTAGPGVGKSRFGREAKQQLQRLVASKEDSAATAALANAVLLHVPWGNGDAINAADVQAAPIEYWLGLRMVLVQLAQAEDRQLPSGSDIMRVLHEHNVSLQSFALRAVYDWLRDSQQASAVILHLDEFQQLLLPESRDIRGPRPTSALGEAMCRALLPCYGQLPTLLLCTGTFNQYTDYLPLEPTLGEVRWHRLDPLDTSRAQLLALQAVPGVDSTDALQDNLPLRFLVDALGGIPRAFEELLAVMTRDWQHRPPHADDSESWRHIWQQLRAAAKQRYSQLATFFQASLPGFHDRLLLTLAALGGARLDPTFLMPSGIELKEALRALPITLTADGAIRFPLLWMSAAMPEQRVHLPKPLEALASYFLIAHVCTDLTWQDYERLVVLYVQFRSWLALQHPELGRAVLDDMLPTAAVDSVGGGGSGGGITSRFVPNSPALWPQEGRLPDYIDADAQQPADILAVLVSGQALYDGLVAHGLRHRQPSFLWISCKRWTDTTFAPSRLETEYQRFATGGGSNAAKEDLAATPEWCLQLDGSNGALREAARAAKHTPLLFTTARWRYDRSSTPRPPLRLVDMAASANYFGGTVSPLVLLASRAQILVNCATKSRLASLVGSDKVAATIIAHRAGGEAIRDQEHLQRVCPDFPERLLPMVSYATKEV